MDFKNDYPDFAAIEHHIRRARIERSVAIAHFIVEGVQATVNGLRKGWAALARLGKTTLIRAQAPSGPAPSR